MYNALREYGIGFTLFIHWAMYYFALFNNYMDWGFNGKISYDLQWCSLCILGIGIGYVFYKCMDDCNVDYLLACVFSFALRFVVICLKPWGFDDSTRCMIFCGIIMGFFCLYQLSNSKSKNRYFKH